MKTTKDLLATLVGGAIGTALVMLFIFLLAALKGWAIPFLIILGILGWYYGLRDPDLRR